MPVTFQQFPSIGILEYSETVSIRLEGQSDPDESRWQVLTLKCHWPRGSEIWMVMYF